MTPQQKAEELINSYRIILMNEDNECGNEILCTSIAKQCATIAVDEVRDNLPLISDIQQYWIEVKQEIEKL